ncbi:hypothetical protein E1293_16455 [Actinomadura darangshiensis]|uniref:Uncharacterized protein n=1 Tax=Actinomadura darangshiensis TaxID=705336 RepID=A0A4R5B912_9ACTN|nr:hypothetical protein [Actinomadura darangshiensis]TDD82501.1 hypothetical protein E1293_16455 [Actinomadura darangshiensis]
MSGPRDARETAEEAGTAAVPADSAPPSFGGTAPPADEAAGETPAADSASLQLPAFGLEAPWWAAESADTSPPGDAAQEEARPAPENPQPAAEFLSAPVVIEDEEEAPETAAPLGTLVAGKGVPSIDSRRAVPAEPIVKPPVSPDDTDPDGFKAVPPAEEVRPEDDTPAGPVPAEAPEENETTVDNPVLNEVAEDRPAPASAFDRAREAEDAAPLAPVLVPDAILPPGFVPPTGSGPFPHPEAVEAGEGAAATAEQPPVITPVYQAEGGVPVDTPPPPGGPTPPAPAKGAGGSKRRPLLIGGGAAVVLAAAAGLFVIGGTGSGGEDAGEKAAEPPAVTQSTAPATPPATPAPAVNIDNEKTDTADLAFHDVFPAKTLQLGGRTYLQDRWSLNREVRYAARGSMLAALRQEQCRKIVRATYIDPKSKLAVTSGLAVMPTKDAALTVSKAGDPATYEWFRGMAGKHSPDIDRAGGYAAATVRGRYVAYAYVQWANGKKAKPGDPVIKQAAQQFIDYDLRPIVARG